MNRRHFAALVRARTMEFVRDRGTMFWNLFFPVLLVFGFAFAFSRNSDTVFKAGVLGSSQAALRFLEIKQIELVRIPAASQADALDRLRKHQLDLVVDPAGRLVYVNRESPRSLMLAEVFAAELARDGVAAFEERTASGPPIRYVDWVVPGVIGMNLLFSCLFGVGFVIVRYRKNGVLKRLKATPVSALTFVSAQAVSRFLIVVVTCVAVYAGTNFFLRFVMKGSYFDLLLITLLGVLCMIALGLLFASRFKSEELTTGLMNVLTIPMMLLSGVFFSLDGAPPALQTFAKTLPLTQIVDGARRIMLEGAGLGALAPNIAYLCALTIALLMASALLFKWE